MTEFEAGRHILPRPDTHRPLTTAMDVHDQETAFTPIGPVPPPEGAPNVVIVLVDDLGFGTSSAFGGPCEMPAAERLADNGLRYTRFHVTALCSPTRQALLTGRNHHSVGMGGTTEMATAAPGYNGFRPRSAATMAQILQGNGYSTAAFGKWHQTPPRCSAAIASSDGASWRQGPHHSAQKSTRTGLSLLRTSCSKESSVTFLRAMLCLRCVRRRLRPVRLRCRCRSGRQGSARRPGRPRSRSLPR